jgi:hypothetical protein
VIEISREETAKRAGLFLQVEGQRLISDNVFMNVDWRGHAGINLFSALFPSPRTAKARKRTPPSCAAAWWLTRIRKIKTLWNVAHAKEAISRDPDHSIAIDLIPIVVGE